MKSILTDLDLKRRGFAALMVDLIPQSRPDVAAARLPPPPGHCQMPRYAIDAIFTGISAEKCILPLYVAGAYSFGAGLYLLGAGDPANQVNPSLSIERVRVPE
jgi:hypothetical protein